MKFQFHAGDRVDFSNGKPNNTPGTVKSRVHNEVAPAYRIKWDDGNTDNATYPEDLLILIEQGE